MGVGRMEMVAGMDAVGGMMEKTRTGTGRAHRDING
jgi:hypothetical protein